MHTCNNKKIENDAGLPNFDKTTTKKRETKLRKNKTDTITTTKNRKCTKINIKQRKQQKTYYKWKKGKKNLLKCACIVVCVPLVLQIVWI